MPKEKKMRELTINEYDEVAGGPGPIVYLVGTAIVAAGSAIGGYLAGKSSGTAESSATVNTDSGTVEISCKAE